MLTRSAPRKASRMSFAVRAFARQASARRDWLIVTVEWRDASMSVSELRAMRRNLLLASVAAWPAICLAQSPASMPSAPAPAATPAPAESPKAKAPASGDSSKRKNSSAAKNEHDEDEDAAAARKAPQRFEPTDKGKADEDIPFPADI